MCGNAENCTTCKVTRKWTGRHKAMYLSEIAHMHSLFGDEEIAVKFHRLAADTAMESYAHFVKRYEITLQTLIVVANVFNQGVLTDKKARKSQSAWNEALRFSKMSKISLDGADETAFISMLCFHGRYSASQENWLEEFRDKLNVAIKSSNSRNMLHLHLSFLCALMKDEKLSRRHYNLSSSIEDHEFPPDIQAKENPWVLLINILQSQPMTPKPLQVVWRRELSPMIILPMEDNHLYHREADVQPFDLNLRFTEDGYLTGNMQMMMPPIRGVYLDPYDGSLCLTSVPGNTQPWNAMTNCLKDYGKQQRPACPLIPTMMELYCDRTGNRVHLLMTESGSICVEKMTGNLATIYWTEPSQKKAKINLVHLLKVKIREYVDNEIEREFTKRMSAVRGFEKEKQKSWKGIEKSREDAKDLLHYCFIRNWKMSLEQLLFQHAYEPVRENMKVKRSTRDDFCKKEEKKERKNRQKMRKFLKCDPFIVELTALPQIYGHTVFLILLCCNKTVWLFLNCTSRDSFRKPKVIVEPMPEFGESVRLSHQWLFGNYNPMCKVGLIPVSLNPQQLFAVTEAGDVCDYLSATSLMEDDGFLQPTVCVFGESIFCIDNDPTDRNSNRLQRRRSRRFDPELDKHYPKNKKKVAWVISVTVFVNDTARDKMESDVTIIAREKILCHQRTEDIVKYGFEHIRWFEAVDDMLTVLTDHGVTFLNPDTLETIPIFSGDHTSQSHLTISDDRHWIVGKRNYLHYLGMNTNKDGVKVIAMAIGCFLVFMKYGMNSLTDDDSCVLTVISCIPLPGRPMEICFLSEKAGFLVSVTLDTTRPMMNSYRENLYHFGYDGRLYAYLPLLGPGPRSFCPTLLPGDKELAAKDPTLGTSGWYVYIRDGYGGLLGLKLQIPGDIR